MCLLNWTSSSPSVGRSLLLAPSRADGGSQLGAPRRRLRTDGEQRQHLRSFHAIYCLHARCQCARFIVPIAIQHRGGEKPVNYHSKIDADIDSLTSMLADLDSHTQDSGAQVMKEHLIYLPFISQIQECLTLIPSHLPPSCTTMCLTTNTSQGITTSLRTRAPPLLRVGPPWATPPTTTTRGSTIPCRLTPASPSHPSTPLPTSRTTTPPPPRSPTPSPSPPPTPLPRPPPGPGSASRSRRRSPSPTLRRAGRPSRPTPLRPLASTCPALLTPKRACRVGTLRIKLQRCTRRQEGLKGAARVLEEDSTRVLCPREAWKTSSQRRVQRTSPAR